MCGIGGWFNAAGTESGETALLRSDRVVAALRHRGPDDAGTWRDSTGNLVDPIAVPAPVLDLPMVDSNGAGDALAVGTLHELVLAAAPDRTLGVDAATMTSAVLSGQCAARWTCMRRGGDRLLTRPELAQLRAAIG